MDQSDSVFPALVASDTEVLPGLSSPASPVLACAVSKMLSRCEGASRSFGYSASDNSWEFADCCEFSPLILFRNSVAHDGEVFAVRSVSVGAFESHQLSAVCISRNVASLGKRCFMECGDLQSVAFEAGSHVRKICSQAFDVCASLRSIAIPPFVGRLGLSCFSHCKSLQSLTFERGSRLAAIDKDAFSNCQSLPWISIPASVTAIQDRAFGASGIGSIEIEDGSVSFRVVKEFLVDFEIRSLIWVIGSPESIQIPSSIEELRPWCCCVKLALRTVEFESDSNLRSIGVSAFAFCNSLKSIWIPSSVEVLPEDCFYWCSRLRTVTFWAESRLRLIEGDAFRWCPSLQSVSIPASVEVVNRQPACFVPSVPRP
jgi:hypothetical protein